MTTSTAPSAASRTWRPPITARAAAPCSSREGDPDDPTLSLSAEEVEEEGGVGLEDLGVEGPALVVRSGGGRTGEQFPIERDRTTIGRTPDCDIFLDDVTVSRSHAMHHAGRRVRCIEDLGSLNGTFLNRRRIEKGELE